MKDFYLSFDTNDEVYEEYMKNKNDVEFDCQGLSFSDDTCSNFTSTEISSHSKLNLSLEIDKKIDELIFKNIQKDMVGIKIQADLNINNNIIKISTVLFIFSLLLFFKPFNLSVFSFYFVLIILPFLFLSIVLEFKNSYLKYSNKLAKIIVYILAIYGFTCFIAFIFLIILKSSNFNIFNNLHTFVFFIPIFGVLFVMTLFWVFLHQGCKKENQLNFFYFVLINLLILNMVAFTIFLKISFELNNLTWTHIFCLICINHLINLIISLTCLNLKFLISFDDKNSDDSPLVVFDILSNMSLIFFLCLLGLFLDNKLDQNKSNALFILSWFFLLMILIKKIYKNRKIQNYFEWKKMVII